MPSQSTLKSHNSNAHDASHPPWALQSRAFVWIAGQPRFPNLTPVAGQLYRWLQQQGHITVLREKDKSESNSYTNPYAYSATSLAVQISATINDTWDFCSNMEEISALDAEVQRIRLQSELRIQFSRFCESAIKQMLYCTGLPERLYAKAALGELLAHDCKPCRRAKQGHHISLLGSLAHHYYACHLLELCLFDHLTFVNRMRNDYASHADSESPIHSNPIESQAAARKTLVEIGNELGHMCQHIGSFEEKMLEEIDLCIKHFPNTPPPNAFMQIPVRCSDFLDGTSEELSSNP